MSLASKNIILTILLNGIEDISSLYEILWDLSPKDDGLELIVISIMKKLIVLGFVELYWCKEPYGKTMKISSLNEGLKIIGNLHYWQAPKKNCSQWPRFETTKKGETFYQQISNNSEDLSVKKLINELECNLE